MTIKLHHYQFVANFAMKIRDFKLEDLPAVLAIQDNPESLIVCNANHSARRAHNCNERIFPL